MLRNIKVICPTCGGSDVKRTGFNLPAGVAVLITLGLLAPPTVRYILAALLLVTAGVLWVTGITSPGQYFQCRHCKEHFVVDKAELKG